MAAREKSVYEIIATQLDPEPGLASPVLKRCHKYWDAIHALHASLMLPGCGSQADRRARDAQFSYS